MGELIITFCRWGNPTETCCTNLVDMASSGIESLLISLCSQTKEDLAEERFRNEVFLDLEKCLACGVLLTKADMSKCEWLCRILIQLFKLPAIAGTIFLTLPIILNVYALINSN